MDRLREGSGEEAVQAGELAASLGVRHHVLTVDWEGAVPTQHKIQFAAREKRYEALLKYCRKATINNILFGHHLDDQIGEGRLAVSMQVSPLVHNGLLHTIA